MPFTSATSVFLLDGKTGMNATAHSRNKTGPNIFSPLFALSENIGILNIPKSPPERYGANRRIKEKLSRTTPNESDSPDSL
jgi:hypothetical protein